MDEDELELLMLTQKNSFKELLKTGSNANKKEQVDAADSSFYIKGRIRDGKGNLLKNRTVTLFSGNKNILVLVDTTKTTKAPNLMKAFVRLKWAHQGMILGPPDYESGALTN